MANKTIIFFFIYLLQTLVEGNYYVENNTQKNNRDTVADLELLYGDIWGTLYHAVENQCDDTPTITGDGSKINPNIASEYRWIAISQDMLGDTIREKMLNNPNIDRFRGKIQYGDTVWIESNNPNINGWWVVHDTKNKRCVKNIDFLQTSGDGSLYDNNRLWNGKFKHLNIYKINNYSYSEYHNIQNNIADVNM